jgi:hypothetical protein
MAVNLNTTSYRIKAGVEDVAKFTVPFWYEKRDEGWFQEFGKRFVVAAIEAGDAAADPNDPYTIRTSLELNVLNRFKVTLKNVSHLSKDGKQTHVDVESELDGFGAGTVVRTSGSLKSVIQAKMQNELARELERYIAKQKSVRVSSASIT